MSDIKEKDRTGESREHKHEHESERERYRPAKRTSGGMWAAVALLTVALVGAGAYGHYILQKYNFELSRLPGLNESLSSLSGRMGTMEVSLRDWTNNWSGLVDRMAQLERRVSANVQIARKQAQELVTEARDRIQAQLDERTRVLEARLAQVESTHDAQRTRMAQLHGELADARSEVTVLREGTSRDLSDLQQQVTQSQGAVDALARRHERRRVDFELSKNQTRELAPGISMSITRTDPSYQRFSGWLWFLPDRRTLWVRQQGAQQPVIFYSKRGGERYEMVVNVVTRDSVVGYLLLPAESGQAAGGAASDLDEE